MRSKAIGELPLPRRSAVVRASARDDNCRGDGFDVRYLAPTTEITVDRFGHREVRVEFSECVGEAKGTTDREVMSRESSVCCNV